MKQYYFIITTLLFFGSAHSQIINIPDPVLKAKLVAYGDTFNPHEGMGLGLCGDTRGFSEKIDMNGNGEIEYFEAYRMCRLYLNDCGISSLEGLQYFPRLQDLYCNNNNLTSLDVSTYPSLVHLECNNNQLTSLNIGSNSRLTSLYCENNLLTTLDVTGMDYGSVYCKNNLLTNLNASGSNMRKIYCQDNLLTTLNVLNCRLIELNCANNQLTSLNLEQNNPYILDCSNNFITTLDFTDKFALTKLTCGNNLLTTLDLRGVRYLERVICPNNGMNTLLIGSSPNLAFLDCSNNALTSFQMAVTTRLSNFNCSNNQLTTLDLNNQPDLIALNCSSNYLTSLYIKNGSIEWPHLMFLNGNPNLEYVCADEAQVSNIASIVNAAGLNAIVDSNCVALSLPEQELSNHSVTIFPNPVQEYLNFKSNEDVDILSVSIYNNLGQLVRTNQLTANTFNIEVSELKTGIYFIRINTNVGSIVSKFLKT